MRPLLLAAVLACARGENAQRREYQGIVDFRGYLERQTRKLASDPIYPPWLYVTQRLVFDIGRDRHEAEDAYGTVLDWLAVPEGRS